MALIKCSECGKEISDKAESCPNCGYVLPKETFWGDMKSLPGKRCPRCKSTNISMSGNRTKTTMNLNPLKPFTLVNHKPTKQIWTCMSCGKTWMEKM